MACIGDLHADLLRVVIWTLGVSRCQLIDAGPHTDSKNVAGSYSALMVCEVGDPVAGGYYMLPQYRAALDIRQGVRWQQIAILLSSFRSQSILPLLLYTPCTS